MSNRAFAIAAHPDDIEFMMAGTLLLLRDAGYEIHYMNIANGSCGTNQHDVNTIIKMRREEAAQACGRVGAVFHESVVNDLEIFYNKEALARVAAVMREVAPEILLLHSPQDYMEDPMNAYRLAVSAAFARGMPNFPVNPARSPMEQSVSVYHALSHGLKDGFGKPVYPDFYVDVTSVIVEKKEMLAAHKSQKEWLDQSQGMDSYIIEMSDLCAALGRLSGQFQYAEGWRRHGHLGFSPKPTNPLGNVLARHMAMAK